MDHIDEFESLFRRAERESFQHVTIPIESVAFITDQTAEESGRRRHELLAFLPMLKDVNSWREISGDQYSNVAELLTKLDEQQTDLVITYRHLQEQSLVPQHSLGVYLDVLSQVATIPVLVLPGTSAHPKTLTGNICDRVMVVADHISGDNGLINYGSRMCPDDGTLWLCHVEDDSVFERYMRIIERIPQIDSEQARQLIEFTLLKEAQDFIDTCIAELKTSRPSVDYKNRVTRGHFLKQYAGLIQAGEIDLLVTNTRDHDQLAMHGMAYSLSVELIDTAMLLL
ncbi:MAG: hypothetical protein O3B13_04895 [Planctomycetota bacterium]|nr:hypothetical protein [Planctomycetota bacterium]